MALYDLLLQGGRTYDPETRTFAREDVAVREGKIVLRAGEIPAQSAATVLDARENFFGLCPQYFLQGE